MQPGGVFEFVHGVPDLAAAERYWAMLGYRGEARGELEAEAAGALYGHHSRMQSVRLAHSSGLPGGRIRLIHWDIPLDNGLEYAPPLAIGSRWITFYTRDILRLRDAFRDQAKATGERWNLTPIVRIPSRQSSSSPVSFLLPFSGIYAVFVIGQYARHAFLQFAGAPGATDDLFGDSPYSCSHPRSANIVTGNTESIVFYSAVFGLTARDPIQLDWTNEPVRAVLAMKEGRSIDLMRFDMADGTPHPLRLFAVDAGATDARHRARLGHLGLTAFSVQLDAGAVIGFAGVLKRNGAPRVHEIGRNEFGEQALAFTAPDGLHWIAVETAAGGQPG